MKNPTSFILLSVWAILFGMGLNAQTSLKEWAEGNVLKNAEFRPKPKFYKADFINVDEDGHGKTPYFPALKIKKIAIICFAVQDDQQFKQSGNKYFRVTETRWTSDNAVKHITETSFPMAVNALKAFGSQNNIEFVTLGELIKSNPQLESVYNNYQLEASWLGNALLVNNIDGSIFTADGTRYINAASAYPDYKFGNSLGLMAKALGVDAVMVIQNEIFSSKEGIAFSKLSLHLLGPNPIPKKDKKYAGFNGAGYNEAMYYLGTEFISKDGAIVIKTDKKGKWEGEDFSGYETLVSKNIQNIFDRMKEVTEQLTK
jgi:hypothetical protein